MSNLPISSPYRSTPDVPVSDEERDQLTTRLNDAFSEGKVSQEDYSARLDRLYAAHTLGELVPVLDGLPPRETHQTPAIVESSGGEAGELTRARSGTSLALVGGGAVVVVVVLIVLLLALLL